MDRQLIKSLIDALETSTLSELEYSKDGSTLRLVRSATPCPAPRTTTPARTAVPPSKAAAALNLVTAPLYGIVHLQRTANGAPFVAIGQAVEAGQVVCTIEAMKVFTDVCTERAGTVAEILVMDAEEVEAGQPLVRLA